MDRPSVFVSSTFTDLQGFRIAVRSSIRRLDAVDVAMEHFGARDNRPLDECKRVIARECDILVGIYAHRYGYTPRGRKTSITEAEYQAARRAELPVLAYIIDDRARWPSKKRATGDAAQRLARFKARIQSSQIVDFFSKKDELAAMVAADLGRHLRTERTRLATIKKLSPQSQERERRLLDRLSRDNPPAERERAASALSALGSEASVPTLVQLMLGDDADLAYNAVRALESGAAVSSGLLSPHARVRGWAAFRVGENALQDHEWGLGHTKSLCNLIQSKAQDAATLEQATHSLAKIGGNEVQRFLLRLLRDPGVPPFVLVKALYGPPRFWSDGQFASVASYDLIPGFIKEASAAITDWSAALCARVARESDFEWLTGEFRTLILERRKQ